MNIKLFTHTDLDGVGCAILAYLAFGIENWGGIAGVSKHATDTAMIYGNTNNGGSTAASVLQPYITCYMWKRTA